MKRALLGVLSGVLCSPLVGCAPPHGDTPGRERIVGLPCEGCDAVFVGMPAYERISSHANIAPEGEPGTPLIVRGKVRDSRNTPVEGVVVYAYQTDDSGLYPIDPDLRNTSAARHGHLRAWAKTDRNGAYEFATIRPGGYPGRPDPEHIHLHIIEPGRCTYYIDDVVFTDDARLTDAQAASFPKRAGPGVTTPTRNDSGAFEVTRDITLGLNIPGYPAR